MRRMSTSAERRAAGQADTRDSGTAHLISEYRRARSALINEFRHGTELQLIDQLLSGPDAIMIEEEVIVMECSTALYVAFVEFPRGRRDLLSQLTARPPCSYAKISGPLAALADIRVEDILDKRAR